MAEYKNYADPPTPVAEEEPIEETPSRFGFGRKRDRDAEPDPRPALPVEETVAFDAVEPKPAASPSAHGKGAAFVIGWILAGLLMGPFGFLSAFLTMKGTMWMRKAMVGVAVGLALFLMTMALFYLLILPNLLESWVTAIQQPVVYDGQ